MSLRAAIGAALTAALLLTDGCGGGSTPPRAALAPRPPLAPGPRTDSDAAIHFEDLPVTRLEKSRVPLPNAANPSQGAANAPVVLQLWSDFECPFCAAVHPVLTELMRSYSGKVRLVWHDYPLPMHTHARLAANAGREAYAQGGAPSFWKFHDAVYETQDAELDADGLARFAARAGLDATRFHECLATLRHDREIDRDVRSGESLGVDGTPAFLVNDYFFIGAVPIEVLRVIVNRALSDAGG